MLPRVKLRLGRLSYTGEQKGVDLRIGLDLVMHARNQAVDVMYLVSGDDDLTEAVEEVQGHGIPVILLVAPDKDGKAHAVSKHLRREADDVVMISPDTIDMFVQARTRPEPEPEGRRPRSRSPRGRRPRCWPGAGRRRPASCLPRRRWCAPPRSSTPRRPGRSTRWRPRSDVRRSSSTRCAPACSPPGCSAPARTRSASCGRRQPQIPGDIDRALLTDLSARTGHYYIEEHDRHLLRERFWVAVPAAGRACRSEVSDR